MYAGLTWQEYWASEGVYEAGNVQFSEAEDSTGCNHKHLNTMEQKKGRGNRIKTVRCICSSCGSGRV